MEVLKGKSVYGGIAIGKIRYRHKLKQIVKRYHISDIGREKERFTQAKIMTIQQLGELHQKARKEVGEDGAAIFEIHQMMLSDEDYINSIENIITKQGLNAEYAVAKTSENFCAMFEEMDDQYMQARSADVKDISERLTQPTIVFVPDVEPTIAPEPHLAVSGLEDLIEGDHAIQLYIFNIQASFDTAPTIEPSPE